MSNDSNHNEDSKNGNGDSASTEFEFKAQVQRVLSLVINSLYTNSEVFLRELISNASDALDKARFLQLTDKEAREQEGEPAIKISLDSDNNTLTIEDNGVGMTRQEVIENLGTIARSGTSDFISQFAELTKEEDKERAIELIGQFGVGFYAVFMVASRVDVHTLSMKQGAEPVLWRSSGEGSFNVLSDDRDTAGTRVVLHLKQDAAEFAQSWRVQRVIEKYSDFVMFPIEVDGAVANKSSALWRTPKSQVTEEQHAEFFKHITQSRFGDSPLMTVHYAVDAPLQFAALLYVPQQAPPDIFHFQKERPGLRLYAKRVLIQENCESLTPVYLRFLRGVVDSEDLQLNVSRETLQDNRTVKQIEQQLTSRTLKGLANLAEEDPDKYAGFWEQFGAVLKEGVSVDFKNKDKIADLCRFRTMRNDDKLVSLKQYVDTKPAAQDKIFYITGTDLEQVRRSPHLEMFRDKDVDVLLLTDPIDEWVVTALAEYDGCKLTSVVHGEIDLSNEDEDEDGDGDEEAKSKSEEEKDVEESLDGAVEAIAKVLADKVGAVRASKRLTQTAACLVSKEGDPGANLERLMKMLDDSAATKKRILEVNPKHAFVRNIAKLVAQDPESSRLKLYSEMLYDQALLSEGVVENPVELAERMQQLLVEVSGQAVEVED